MGTRTRIIWAGVLAPVVLLLGVIAAWAIDTGAAGGEVLRNVELAGADIGGLGSDELIDRVESLDAEMRDRAVRIATPEASYETTAGDIGLSIDRDLTAQAALDEGRTAVLPMRPLRWVAGFVAPSDVEIHYSVDRTVAGATLRELEGEARVAPTEPTIQSIGGEPFEPVPGAAGSGIDPARLARALTAAARDTPVDEPVEVRLRPSALAPRLDDSAAEAAAARANSMTDTTLSVTAADMTIELPPPELRRLVQSRATEDSIAVGLDTDAVLAVLQEQFAPLETAPQDASFTVAGGVPQLTPAVTGISCCESAAAEAVEAAFVSGQTEVTIDLTEVEPEFTTEEAEALGIVEEIGSPTAFGPTTHHACCEGRVTNIHRIADIVRGTIIRPGETFSVNGFVGRRTREKGFVSAGVIYNGVVTEDVGGGVSQFATTLFNAALFGGLDFGTYQSHSLYISRYPRGHEATISYPNPDLEIINNTDYGVMLWPTYTGTSLTVHLYSTRHIEVEVGEPSPSSAGNCTRWTTPRTRTYPDGTTDRDSVSALYRPAEGVNC